MEKQHEVYFSTKMAVRECFVPSKTWDVLEYIPMMEKEFARVERIIGRELTPEAAYFYYDFYDMAHALKNLLKNERSYQLLEVLGDQRDVVLTGEEFRGMTWDSLWRMLIKVVNMDNNDHGYLEKKIKDKTILKILTALKDSFR